MPDTRTQDARGVQRGEVARRGPVPRDTSISSPRVRCLLEKDTATTMAGALRVAPALPGRKVSGARRLETVRGHIVPAASKLDAVEQAPPDPILGVTEAFKKCTAPTKLNLGVGAYRTEDLQPYVLRVVRKAEQRLLEKNENKEYLPIDGLQEFKDATVKLLLGEGHPAIQEGRVACVQSLSGTGSLRVGAAFVDRFMPGKQCYISNPTWGNHKNIFADAGVEWKHYRYFEPKTIGLDFEGMMEDIRNAPDGSVILLHGCAHNPTGIDPTKEQWKAIAELCQKKGHLPFFDVAYQGFATGDLDQDAYAPRLFADMGIEYFCTQSYAKNLGLYGERVGALVAVLNSKEVAGRVLSQMKRIARAIYSNPPAHGARIARDVISDPAMFQEWKEEMREMAGRIATVRQVLHDALAKRMPEKDWSFVLRQIGMFSFTGLSKAQCDNMTNKWNVFMTSDGRISLAGLSQAKSDYLADAIVDSVKNVKA